MPTMEFNEIWAQFNWVLDEMKKGMCFFEGYIPNVSVSDIGSPLSDIISRSKNYDLRTSTWSDDSTETDWSADYSLTDYVSLFATGRIVTLCFVYEISCGGVCLCQKLMFYRENETTILEIICYRDAILGSKDPQNTLSLAVSEFRKLKQAFGGDSLFIGPDTLNYPKSKSDYPGEWLRIDS